MEAECSNGLWYERDGPPATLPLGCLLFRRAVERVHTPVDRQSSLLEIYVRPLQPQEFAAPETRGEGEHVESFEPVPRRRSEKRLGLGNGEGKVLLVPLSRRPSVAGDVLLHEIPLFGLGKRFASRAMYVLHGSRRKPVFGFLAVEGLK